MTDEQILAFFAEEVILWQDDGFNGAGIIDEEQAVKIGRAILAAALTPEQAAVLAKHEKEQELSIHFMRDNHTFLPLTGYSLVNALAAIKATTWTYGMLSAKGRGAPREVHAGGRDSWDEFAEGVRWFYAALPVANGEA